MAEMYRQLAADYHLFFPARQAQLDMLDRLAGGAGGRVIDVGSGTGEYVSALVQRGYDAIGLEIDETMHREATNRHHDILLSEAGQPRLLIGDMLRLDKYVSSPLRLAFSIGNTLAHLSSEAQVASVIDAMWKLTRPDGVVVIQLVNFDHIMAGGHLAAVDGQQRVSDRGNEPAFVYDLPTLSATREDGSRIEFERQFLLRRAADLEDPRSPPEKLIFHTVFNSGDNRHEGYTPLLLLTTERLRFCLPRDADREWFGGFNGEAWDAEALASVIVLK